MAPPKPPKPVEPAAAAAVPTGRFTRLSKLGGTATTVTARHAFQKLKDTVSTPEERVAGHKAANTKSAQDLVRTLAQMKGAAMKVGQLLSLDPQMLPPEVRDALGTLQQSAPPMPWEVVEREIVTALGMPVHKAFLHFEQKALGAASIGQVHRAVTHGGMAVAVKVQYPGVAESIDSDVANLGTLLQLGKLVVGSVRIEEYLEEFRQVLHQEADYLAEARNLIHYKEVLKAFPFARVPAPLMELSRKNVLTMELMEGQNLFEVLTNLGPVERDALATRFLDMFMRMFHELHVLHADPHPGNFLLDAQGNIVLLDFGCVRAFEPKFANGFTHIMRAHWRGDAEILPKLYANLGFMMPQHIDGALLYEWHDIVLAPFLKDAPFDFSTWKLEQQAFAFVKDHLVLKLMAPPKAALFYFRVCAGLRGMLTRTGSKVNVHRLTRDLEARLRAAGN